MAVKIKEVLDENEAGDEFCDDNADWISASITMEMGELEGEWWIEDIASEDINSLNYAHEEVIVSQAQETPTSTQIEIFNSGTSCHISPHCNAFTSFQSIAPHPLHAANKQNFNAVGKGDIVLDILNGVVTSQLRLTEVLYSPEAGYTLISIG